MALGNSIAVSLSSTEADMAPPAMKVPGPAADAPVSNISSEGLRNLGQRLSQLWVQYRSDRRIAELRWLRDQRQYLGIYDPEIDKELQPNRSRAYPKMTRVKCISVLSRLMSLMFPGDERNWSLTASPNPEMRVEDVEEAIQEAQKRDQDSGADPRPIDDDYIMSAVQSLADQRAADLSTLIDDQLQELGGDQTLDYISLNRKVIRGATIYGLGLLKGPYVKEKRKTVWSKGPDGRPTPKIKTIRMPMFEVLKIWDFYPDLSAKTLRGMDGHFERIVYSRSQLKALSRQEPYFKSQIESYLATHETGNYKPQEFELELRVMGIKVNVNEMKADGTKYEVLKWSGKMAGNFMNVVGIEVPEDKLTEEIDTNIWMIDGIVIGAELNPWDVLGVEDMDTLHWFLFDEDDTSPVGFGIPNILRDTQMSLAAAVRMMMDNASVVCGPQLEINTELLRLDQDLDGISAYKIWYREGTGADAQWPAVRDININAHLEDLKGIVDMFMKFADIETFVGPATGGDMSEAPSEPMRTLGGASMIRGDAALPFKDIVRSYDQFTQSVILSIVKFNRKFNPDRAKEGDYDVIARGATSLIAKELRGAQIDQLATTLSPDEALHVDMRKLVEQRFKVRDLTDLLVSNEEADRRQKAKNQSDQQMAQSQQQLAEANIRKLLSDAFKNIAAGQKSAATANAEAVNTALALLEQGVANASTGATGGVQGAAGPGAGGQQPAGAPGDNSGGPSTGDVPGGGPGQAGAGVPGAGSGGPTPGSGPGLS